MHSKFNHVIGYCVLLLIITFVSMFIGDLFFFSENSFYRVIGLGIPGFCFGLTLTFLRKRQPNLRILFFSFLIFFVSCCYWLLLDGVLLPIINDQRLSWSLGVFFFSLGGIKAFLTGVTYKLVLRRRMIFPPFLLLAGGLSMFIPIVFIENSFEGDYFYMGRNNLWALFVLCWQMSVGLIFILHTANEHIDKDYFKRLVSSIGKE